MLRRFIQLFSFIIFILSLKGNFFIVYSQGSNVQDVAELIQDFDDKWGVDYDLVNGKKHVNFYGNALGNPYLSGDEFAHGWIKIKGQVFRERKLNYDIYNQEVISEYNSELIGIQRYVIPYLYLESFEMNGRLFRKIKIGDNKERIYEVISEGKYTVLFTHDKTYTLSTSANNRNYRFSEDILRMYLLRDNRLLRFKNNRQFRKLFPEPVQDDIKAYMKRSRINVKRSNVFTIKSLMDNINTL